MILHACLPLWRNWQTHLTQNQAGNHAGSSPASGIELFSETLDFIVFSRVSDFFLLVLGHLWGKNFYFFYLGIPFFF